MYLFTGDAETAEVTSKLVVLILFHGLPGVVVPLRQRVSITEYLKGNIPSEGILSGGKRGFSWEV